MAQMLGVRCESGWGGVAAEEGVVLKAWSHSVDRSADNVSRTRGYRASPDNSGNARPAFPIIQGRLGSA